MFNCCCCCLDSIFIFIPVCGKRWLAWSRILFVVGDWWQDQWNWSWQTDRASRLCTQGQNRSRSRPRTRTSTTRPHSSMVCICPPLLVRMWDTTMWLLSHSIDSTQRIRHSSDTIAHLPTWLRSVSKRRSLRAVLRKRQLLKCTLFN